MKESIQEEVEQLRINDTSLREMMEMILARVISIEMHCKECHVPEVEDETQP